MSDVLRIAIGIAVIIYFLIVIHFLRLRLLDLKYTLLWIGAGIVMAIIIIWPEILYAIIDLLGITLPVNGLFAVSIAFLIIILMSLTSIVSKQTNRIKQLVQNLALLEKRIRELEEK